MSQADTETLSRRGLLGAGAVLAALAAAPAHAEEDHQNHEGHAAPAADAHAGHAAAPKHKALIDSALKCVNLGEVCVAHCLSLLSTGDTSLKDCVRSVQVMLPMCAALARAGALDAQRLKDIAKVCIDICDDCEKECKKHAEHHAACKACGESCAECIAECKKAI